MLLPPKNWRICRYPTAREWFQTTKFPNVEIKPFAESQPLNYHIVRTFQHFQASYLYCYENDSFGILYTNLETYLFLLKNKVIQVRGRGCFTYQAIIRIWCFWWSNCISRWPSSETWPNINCNYLYLVRTWNQCWYSFKHRDLW